MVSDAQSMTGKTPTIKNREKYLAPKFPVTMKITKPHIVTGIGYLNFC